MRMSVRLCMVSVYAENWRISEKKGTFTKLILTLLVLLFIPFPYTVSAVFVCMYVFMPHSPGILLFVSCFLCVLLCENEKKERKIHLMEPFKNLFRPIDQPVELVGKSTMKSYVFQQNFRDFFFFGVLVRTTYKNVLWQKNKKKTIHWNSFALHRLHTVHCSSEGKKRGTLLFIHYIALLCRSQLRISI